jgi:hypothetical protein
VDLLFTRCVVKGQRRMNAWDFESCLVLLSQRKGISLQLVRTAVAGCSGGPVLAATRAESVRFHDDRVVRSGSATPVASSMSFSH